MSEFTKDPDKLVVEGLQALPSPYRQRVDDALAELAETRKRQRALIEHIKAALIEHARATARFRVGDFCEWREYPWSPSVRVKVLDVMVTAQHIPAKPEWRAPETVRCEVKYRFRELRGTRAAGREWTINDSRIGELTRVEAPAKVPKAEKAKEVKP